MWGAYHYKVADRWSPPLAWLPRWFSANSYSTLFDSVSQPAASGFGLTVSYSSPLTGTIPSSWQLPSTTPSSTGSVWQGFFESLTLEKQRLYLTFTSLMLGASKYMDVAEPAWAWYVEDSENIEKLEVLVVGGTWVEITRALGFLDLLTAGEWRWIGNGRGALLYGLDLQKQTTQRRVDDWQFLSVASTWTSGCILYFQHPAAGSWIPIHPLCVRADGLLHFTHTATSMVRTHYVPAASGLPTVNVRLNGNVQTSARRVELWNSVDERSLWAGVRRRELEFNETLARALMVNNWFGGQTQSGVCNALSAALRQGSLMTVAGSALTSITFPQGSTGYSVRGIPQYIYVRERLWPETTTDDEWHSLYADPDMGCIYYNGLKVDHSAFTADGTLTIDAMVADRQQRPVADWRLGLWTATSSSMQFSTNLRPSAAGDELLLYFPCKVRVRNPSWRSLRRSFLRTSPTYRWSGGSFPSDLEFSGLALFT